MLVLQETNSVCAVIKNQIADLKLLEFRAIAVVVLAVIASSAIPKGFTK